MLCRQCSKVIIPSGIGTGYGIDKDNSYVCYECFGKNDREYMRIHDRMTLYFVRKDKFTCEVTNWSGTLRMECSYRKGRHNIAGTRYDVWFTVNGDSWYGVQYGENTQLLHCRKLKG